MSKEKRNVPALLSAVALAAAGFWTVAVVSPSTAFAAMQDEQVFETTDEVTLPAVVTQVKPEYTAEAISAQIEGTMRVSIVVKRDGTVGEARVSRSLDPTYGLDEQGLMAARQFRFKPGTRDGMPVAVRVELQFTFTLK